MQHNRGLIFSGSSILGSLRLLVARTVIFTTGIALHISSTHSDGLRFGFYAIALA
jgi:hypothetical protein